jgi:hypothetical protein
VLGKFVHFLCVSFVAGWIVGRVEVEWFEGRNGRITRICCYIPTNTIEEEEASQPTEQLSKFRRRRGERNKSLATSRWWMVLMVIHFFPVEFIFWGSDWKKGIRRGLDAMEWSSETTQKKKRKKRLSRQKEKDIDV